MFGFLAGGRHTGRQRDLACSADLVSVIMSSCGYDESSYSCCEEPFLTWALCRLFRSRPETPASSFAWNGSKLSLSLLFLRGLLHSLINNGVS